MPEERVEADVRDELLEHGRALGVGDAIEVDFDGMQVRNVAAMGCVEGSWSCR